MKGAPSLTQIPLALLRAGSALPRAEPVPLPHVEDRTIPGAASDIKVRIYRPRTEATLPLLVYFHGGGFVLGDLDTHDSICRGLAQAADAVVMAVDYRLAPENPFPAAPDDCFAATSWAASHAAELGIDPTRIAVGGDSAGGNLAAVVALRARDEGGPALKAQLLVYPVTDNHLHPTRSMIDNGDGYFLTREAMLFFDKHYFADPAHMVHPHFAVLRVEDLAGLPPSYVLTAEYDPLLDEGEAYAARLAAAGVPVEQVRALGVIHGFFGMAGIDRGAQAVLDAGRWLRDIFKE
jgi:acetyl esterase